MDIPTWTVIATGGAVFGWFALFFVAERLAPAVQPMVPTGLPRLACNAAFWLLNTLLSPLAVLPLTAWAAAHSLNVRPEWWAGLPALAFDVLLLDLLIYWWHRANHEWRLLWRFHEVHHLDRFLNSTTAIRFHFGEVLLSAGARAAVILLLGFPFVSIVLFEIPAVVRDDLPPLQFADSRRDREGAVARHHRARHPLGASSRRPRRHQLELRHALQLLGPHFSNAQPDAANADDGDRRRR